MAKVKSWKGVDGFLLYLFLHSWPLVHSCTRASWKLHNPEQVPVVLTGATLHVLCIVQHEFQLNPESFYCYMHTSNSLLIYQPWFLGYHWQTSLQKPNDLAVGEGWSWRVPGCSSRHFLPRERTCPQKYTHQVCPRRQHCYDHNLPSRSDK